MARPAPPRAAPARSSAPARATARAAGARPLAGGPSGWDALSERARHFICAGFLLAVGVAFYAPALFSGKAVVGGDAVQWRSMAASMIDFHTATGEEPLWSTNAFAGMPGYMITYFASIPGADSLFNALRSVMWPLSHLIALLLGTYGLVYTLTRSSLSGVLAAVAFGLTTYLPVIVGAGHNSKYIALCYTPALLWAFVHALRRPGLLSGLLFAAALGVNLRAGHPQITYYAAFALALWWLAEGIAAYRAGRGAGFAKATGFLALGTLLAVGMVMHPYLLQLEYKDYTTRGAVSAAAGGDDAAWRYAMAWSQGPSELLTLLVANAFGGAGGTYFGPKPFTGGPHYVGVVVLLLAFVGIARGRRPLAWGLGAAALVMTAFALGEYFPLLNRPMYEAFPLFDSFRVPETWLALVACVLAVLAGVGAAALARRPDDTDEAARSTTRAAYAALGVLGALVLFLFATQGGRGYAGDPAEVAQTRAQAAAQIAEQNGVAPDDPRVAQAADEYVAGLGTDRARGYGADLTRTLVFLLLAAAFVVLHRRGRIPAWAMQGALALLVTVDLFGVGRRYFNEEILAPAEDPAAGIERYAYDTFIEGKVREAGGPGRFRVLTLDAGDPTSNARPSAFYESLGGYHGAKLRVYQDFLDHVLSTPDGGLNPNALRLMGVRYVAARGLVPGYRAAFQDPATGIVVGEDSAGAPRAWFVSAVETVPTAPALWARLQQPGFDVHRTALVLPGTNVTTTPVNAARSPTLALEAYGPRRIRYAATTDAPRLLVLSEVYYPAGWAATVDGRSTPIHRVDHLLRGVEVPAGQHRVELRFDPPRHRAGLLIAGVSSLLVYGGIAGLLALAFVRRRRGAGEPETDGPVAGGPSAGGPGDAAVPESDGVRDVA